MKSFNTIADMFVNELAKFRSETGLIPDRIEVSKSLYRTLSTRLEPVKDKEYKFMCLGIPIYLNPKIRGEHFIVGARHEGDLH